MVRYAFETMNLNRVSLHVFEFNVRGIRAYEKVGFRQEAIFRQAVFREGRYWNTISASAPGRPSATSSSSFRCSRRRFRIGAVPGCRVAGASAGTRDPVDAIPGGG